MEKVCCLLDSFVDLRTFKTLPGGMKEKRTFLYHAVTFFLSSCQSWWQQKDKTRNYTDSENQFYPAEFRFCIIVIYYMGKNHGHNTFDYLNEFSVR